jgi:hypothetical protein
MFGRVPIGARSGLADPIEFDLNVLELHVETRERVGQVGNA